MQELLLSIVIPCYNHGYYIEEAISSIEEYKNNDYEIIILNDGSTDSFTNTKLNELKEKGYNVIFQKNQGLGKTRNNGIKLAKGKYILPLDADNKIKPDFISRALEVLENNLEISVVYTDRQLFGTTEGLVKVGKFDFSRLVHSNYIDACAVFRKNLWEEIGGYDDKMPLQGLEDWDFWLSAVEKGLKFYYIGEPLFLYRVTENSMIKQLKENPRNNEVSEYIYKKHITSLVKEYRLAFNDSKILRIQQDHPVQTALRYILRWIRGR